MFCDRTNHPHSLSLHAYRNKHEISIDQSDRLLRGHMYCYPFTVLRIINSSNPWGLFTQRSEGGKWGSIMCVCKIFSPHSAMHVTNILVQLDCTGKVKFGYFEFHIISNSKTLPLELPFSYLLAATKNVGGQTQVISNYFVFPLKAQTSGVQLRMLI